MSHRTIQDQNFSCFSDQSTFFPNDTVNRHSFRYQLHVNPHIFQEVTLYIYTNECQSSYFILWSLNWKDMVWSTEDHIFSHILRSLPSNGNKVTTTYPHSDYQCTYWRNGKATTNKQWSIWFISKEKKKVMVINTIYNSLTVP